MRWQFDGRKFAYGRYGQSETWRLSVLMTRTLDAFAGLLSLADGADRVGDNYKTVRSYLWKSRATMGKVMISLTDEAEELVREEVGKLYYGRTGGFSIFFEQLIRRYFNGHMKEKKPK